MTLNPIKIIIVITPKLIFAKNPFYALIKPPSSNYVKVVSLSFLTNPQFACHLSEFSLDSTM